MKRLGLQSAFQFTLNVLTGFDVWTLVWRNLSGQHKILKNGHNGGRSPQWDMKGFMEQEMGGKFSIMEHKVVGNLPNGTHRA